MKSILLYGANGYTGALAAEVAKAKGLREGDLVLHCAGPFSA